MDIPPLAQQYRDELKQNILPFWERYALDSQYGGVFEAIDERGEVISTDKPVALQAQAVWAFAFAHNRMESNADWLGSAIKTAEFLLQKGRDPKGDWYQYLDRRGMPIDTPEDSRVGWHAVLGFGQLARATGEEKYAEVARKSFVRLLRRRESILKKEQQGGTGGRAFKCLEEFALIGHALLESEVYMDKKWYRKTLESYVQELSNDFYDKRTDILLENVTPEGHFWDCPAGRMLVPGRVFEVAGLMLDIADRIRNRRLLNQMIDLIELTIRAAWDESSAGFYYQMDIKSFPSLDPRWCHKLAWVHLAAQQTLLKAHLLSARPIFLETFEKTHAYMWEHFPDQTHGEWFCELTREGEPFLRHKITGEKNFQRVVQSMVNTARLLDLVGGAADHRTGEPPVPQLRTNHPPQNAAAGYPQSSAGKSPPIRD
jgi:N-acylglucosamine 2-epimerase